MDNTWALERLNNMLNDSYKVNTLMAEEICKLRGMHVNDANVAQIKLEFNNKK